MRGDLPCQNLIPPSSSSAPATISVFCKHSINFRIDNLLMAYLCFQSEAMGRVDYTLFLPICTSKCNSRLLLLNSSMSSNQEKHHTKSNPYTSMEDTMSPKVESSVSFIRSEIFQILVSKVQEKS